MQVVYRAHWLTALLAQCLAVVRFSSIINFDIFTPKILHHAVQIEEEDKNQRGRQQHYHDRPKTAGHGGRAHDTHDKADERHAGREQFSDTYNRACIVSITASTGALYICTNFVMLLHCCLANVCKVD